ncbi:hypothetical protein GN244_ATG17285 [Phytophthora infestans]|nr:hypothetical protein GN244_ATG17285 [Phytophthora infestans]
MSLTPSTTTTGSTTQANQAIATRNWSQSPGNSTEAPCASGESYTGTNDWTGTGQRSDSRTFQGGESVETPCSGDQSSTTSSTTGQQQQQKQQQ